MVFDQSCFFFFSHLFINSTDVKKEKHVIGNIKNEIVLIENCRAAANLQFFVSSSSVLFRFCVSFKHILFIFIVLFIVLFSKNTIIHLLI